MNYVTTNIRIPEEDYLRLKAEAAQKRKSLSAIFREKITVKKKSKSSARRLMEEIRELAKKNARYIPKGFDSVKALREIRYGDQ